jgi:hypothetical protein
MFTRIAFSLLLTSFALAQSSSSLVPPPSNGLVGGSNYYLQNGRNLLHQVEVKISIKEDLVFDVGNGTVFMLQVFGPLLDDPAEINYQQIFVAAVGGNFLSCAYKTFNSLFEPVSIEHIPVVTSQNITTLPAGTEIFITLNTNVQLGSSIVSIDFGIFINGETLSATIPANIIGTSAIAAL